jgi:hypothetical protein
MPITTQTLVSAAAVVGAVLAWVVAYFQIKQARRADLKEDQSNTVQALLAFSRSPDFLTPLEKLMRSTIGDEFAKRAVSFVDAGADRARWEMQERLSAKDAAAIEQRFERIEQSLQELRGDWRTFGTGVMKEIRDLRGEVKEK